MRWLRGLLGTLRARLFGAGEVIPVEGGPVGIVACTHPAKALTACTYQLGPWGWGWYYRCRQCLAWFGC